MKLRDIICVIHVVCSTIMYINLIRSNKKNIEIHIKVYITLLYYENETRKIHQNHMIKHMNFNKICIQNNMTNFIFT